MEFRELVAFVMLGDTLSFSRTAEMLYSTRSTISKQIARLEMELGVSLLRRDTHNVELTSEGERFLSSIRPAIGIIEQASLDIKEKTPEQSTILNIGFAETLDDLSWFVQIILKSILQFNERNPGTFLHFEPMPAARLGNAVLQKEVDAAILVDDGGLLEGGLLKSKTLHSDQMVLMYCPEEEGLEPLEALRRAKDAFLGERQLPFSDGMQFFASIGISPNVRIVDDFFSVLYNVVKRHGIGVCPKEMYERIRVPKLMSYDTGITSDLKVVWNADHDKRFLQEFVDSLQMAE